MTKLTIFNEPKEREKELCLKLVSRPDGAVELTAVDPETGKTQWYVLAILEDGTLCRYAGIPGDSGLKTDYEDGRILDRSR